MPPRHRLTGPLPSALLAVIGGGVVSSPFACSSVERLPTLERRDSIGVEIVINGDLSSVPSGSLQVRLEVGRTSGGGAEEFFDVRDAVLTSEGSVAVLNAGTAEVRLFDQSGRHLRSFGGRGQGPGEFERPRQLLLLPADSLGVWDPWARRFTVFDLAGRVGRTTSIAMPDAGGHLVKTLPEGRLLARLGWLDASSTDTGSRAFGSRYLVVSPDGVTERRLPDQPFTTLVRTERAWELPHFAAMGVEAGVPDGYWVGSGSTEELRLYDDGGDIRRIVRWAGRNRDVRDEHVEALLAERLAASEYDDDAFVRAEVVRHPRAEKLPAYGRLLGDAGTGGVWVEEYRLPGAGALATWTRFSWDGAATLRIEIPDGTEILSFVEHAALAIRRDDLGVAHVQLLDIVETARAAPPSHGVDGR